MSSKNGLVDAALAAEEFLNRLETLLVVDMKAVVGRIRLASSSRRPQDVV